MQVCKSLKFDRNTTEYEVCTLTEFGNICCVLWFVFYWPIAEGNFKMAS